MICLQGTTLRQPSHASSLQGRRRIGFNHCSPYRTRYSPSDVSISLAAYESVGFARKDSKMLPAVLTWIVSVALMLPSDAGAVLKDVKALSPELPIYDGANIIPQEKQADLDNKLIQLESESGWRVRVVTYNGPSEAPVEGQLRKAWSPDGRTVVVQFDPTSPNIIAFPYIGDEVLSKLRRPFWTELQGRFGNLYYVREEGEQSSVLNSLSALTGCLEAPEGCVVVPGVPSDQYVFTLCTSIAGGIVAGASSRIKPQGFVQRSFVWVLLFSPLWASLFISFGLGPLVSRTSDLTPVLSNTAAFLLAAASPYLLSAVLKTPTDPSASSE
ncbi:hypothetical protein CEUSTIGMA_g6481.t1 [Chlamydomonas eustigma]|uniref:TPM domain-containing protein n=1 Tax=Chlamydomonas eustigma TaxID=1157962 RepID=A0A250X7H4_9CHLO|nr:hypothetical protein CEUSTIGMA_g6481.t1 [Chlamydomonas eustigma]|eukprot:GAX79041.1 hypothetical protein CEUSTIGMA_g6481.t1 [Chlamydomonas eustigma]